jgi:hypothetical protein
MKKWTRRKKSVLFASLLVALLGVGIFQLLSAFTNVGQEFGAYGQYHRVLRVIRGMEDYAIVGHRVRRKLEFAHLFHVEEFAMSLRDKAGRIAEISFVKDTDEMNEHEDAKLRIIIKRKFGQAIGDSTSRKAANKALEPTTFAVTSRAIERFSEGRAWTVLPIVARGAPAKVVAHL